MALGVITLAACAPKVPTLPSGPGTPYPDFAAAYTDATSACSGVKTLRASMNMSGKAGSTKLRGRVDAGFAAPGKLRLEGVPPWGKPVFVLVAEGGRGTLVLTREDRVLKDARPDQIVEALAGIALDPDALRTIVSGCGFGGVPPASGFQYGANWLSAPIGDGTVYLRRGAGGWEMAGGTRGSITALYSDYANGRPATIRIRAEAGGKVTADATLRLSDVDINTTLDPRTFDVTADLPQRPLPLTLEELRRAGPLGSQESKR